MESIMTPYPGINAIIVIGFLIIGLILFFYPLVALGRIWNYSEQLTEIIKKNELRFDAIEEHLHVIRQAISEQVFLKESEELRRAQETPLAGQHSRTAPPPPPRS